MVISVKNTEYVNMIMSNVQSSLGVPTLGLNPREKTEDAYPM